MAHTYSLTVDSTVFQSAPQKCPIFDSATAFSSPLGAPQGLFEKQLSSVAHSSPRGQGVLVSQFLACSSHVVPQKFVLTVGILDGDNDDVESDGDEVIGKLGDDVADWVDCVTSSILPVLGCNVGELDDDVIDEVVCVTSSLLYVLGCNVGEFDDDVIDEIVCVTSSLLFVLGCNVVKLDVDRVDCVTMLGCNVGESDDNVVDWVGETDCATGLALAECDCNVHA